MRRLAQSLPMETFRVGMASLTKIAMPAQTFNIQGFI